MTSNVFCFASNQSKLWCGSSKPSTFVRPNQSNSDKKMFRKTFFFQVFILVLIFFNVAWKFEAFRVLGVPGVPVNPISTRAGRLCPPNNTAHQIIPAPPDLQTFLLTALSTREIFNCLQWYILCSFPRSFRFSLFLKQKGCPFWQSFCELFQLWLSTRPLGNL